MFVERDPVNKFIDDLVEGVETSFKAKSASMNLQLLLQQEYEMRNLPAIELIRFDRSPAKWPEYIHSFHQNIHSKVTFTDNIRMMRLINLLDGDAKKAVQSIGSNGLFYASALKSFRNPLLVATFRMKTLFDKPHINGRDRIALREYHQQLKMSNTWLISMGYETPLLSSDNLTKALMRLPLNSQQDFLRLRETVI